jgi:Fic family protein
MEMRPDERDGVNAWRAACYHRRMNEIRAAIAARKAELDRLRPLAPAALARLDHFYDIELTYTSNAIEGNTLSAVETTLLIEKGVTIGGKPLKDHLEAIDHYDAIRYVRELGRASAPLGETDIRGLHRLVMQRSAPEIAGRYADLGRYVRTETGRHEFPSPAQIPAMMGDLALWLRSAAPGPEAAFAAHRRLVDIHPFNDGNGWTARLLMNLILIRAFYPPVAVRPEDFDALLYERLNDTLADYIATLGRGSAPGG